MRLSGCRSSSTPRALRKRTTGAPVFSARAPIAPPPIQIIGFFAAFIIATRRAIFSGSGVGLACGGSGSTGVTSAMAGSWSSGISSAAGLCRPDIMDWKAAASLRGASVGSSMRSA